MRPFAAVVFLLITAGNAQAANPAAVMGNWWTEKRDGVIRIYPCGAGVCGRLVGVTGYGPDGEPPLTWQGQPRCQFEIIPGGKMVEDGIWDSHIINPINGNEYTITLHAGADGRLQLRGYVGIPLFGQTVYWTRFDGHLTPDCHIGD